MSLKKLPSYLSPSFSTQRRVLKVIHNFASFFVTNARFYERIMPLGYLILSQTFLIAVDFGLIAGLSLSFSSALCCSHKQKALVLIHLNLTMLLFLVRVVEEYNLRFVTSRHFFLATQLHFSTVVVCCQTRRGARRLAYAEWVLLTFR